MVIVELTHPESESGHAILRSYFDEVVGRYHRRDATPDELERAMREAPSDNLVPPTGALLVARSDEERLGCVGMRVGSGAIGEIARLFVVPSARRMGLGQRLMCEIEVIARELGVRELRLGTRHDLVEAQQLYARIGYEATAAFNDEPYVDRWFRKWLD